MILLTVFILGWFICAAISVSIFLGYFQGRFPQTTKKDYREDLGRAWVFGLLGGPFSLLIGFGFSGFCCYGLMNPFVLNKYRGVNND